MCSSDLLDILLFGSLGRKEDLNITVVALSSSHLTFTHEDAFLTAQDTFLAFRHSRLTFIKFLRLLVPHVLQGDANPTAKALVENGEGNFPLTAIPLI